MTPSLLALALAAAPAPAPAPARSPPVEILESRPLRSRALRGCSCRRLTYRVPEGPPVVGFEVRPRDLEGPRPLLVYNRGGAHSSKAMRPRHLGWLCRLARRGGYVAVASQYRGAGGSGGRDELGGRDLDDVLGLTRWARGLPGVQPEATYMLGISRGGGMTYMAIARGLRLAAAAVVGAPTDLASLYSRFGPMRRRHIARALGGDPEEAPGAYRLRSAADWPERLRVPLLILHGGGDGVIPASQAAQLVDGLREHGLPHRLEVFSGGDHLLVGRARQRDEAILEWFAAHPEAAAPAWLRPRGRGREPGSPGSGSGPSSSAPASPR